MSISLVDEIIRQILMDTARHLDYLVTYNRRDFDYYCQLRNVAIIDEKEFL